MPLNSKPNDLHIHLDNYQSNFLKICDYEPDLTIQFPSYNNSSEFHILSAGQSVFTFNPLTSVYNFDTSQVRTQKDVLPLAEKTIHG